MSIGIAAVILFKVTRTPLQGSSAYSSSEWGTLLETGPQARGGLRRLRLRANTYNVLPLLIACSA